MTDLRLLLYWIQCGLGQAAGAGTRLIEMVQNKEIPTLYEGHTYFFYCLLIFTA